MLIASNGDGDSCDGRGGWSRIDRCDSGSWCWWYVKVKLIDVRSR